MTRAGVSALRVFHFREPVRVLFHLGEGYTRVFLERTEGIGLANGGIEWDIPTEAIPPHLRGIGSRFLLAGQNIIPEKADSLDDLLDDLRAAARSFQVEEL